MRSLRPSPLWLWFGFVQASTALPLSPVTLPSDHVMSAINGAVALLLTVIYASEMCFRYCLAAKRRRHTFSQHSQAKRILAAASAAKWLCSIVAFVYVFEAGVGACGDNHQIDADIGGIGTRLAVYLPMVFSVISLGLGMLYAEGFGTKELGIAQAANLFASVLPLLTIGKSHFQPSELLIAWVMTDAQWTSISMSYSSKDALADTLYIRLTTLLGILVLGVEVKTLMAMQQSGMDSGCCVTIAWFGSLRSCSRASPAFWTYFVLRILDWMHAVWVAMSHTAMYRLNSQTDLPGRGFNRLPATAHTDWIGGAGYIVVLIAAIEKHLGSLGLSHAQGWKQWGQTVAMVVACIGIGRWFVAVGRFAQPSCRRLLFNRGRGIELCPSFFVSEMFKLRLRREFQRWKISYSRLGVYDAARIQACGFSLIAADARAAKSAKARGHELLSKVEQGKLREVEELLAEGTFLSAEDESNKLPLDIAIRQSDYPMITLLLDYAKFSDLNWRDSGGFTLLTAAAYTCNVELMQILMRYPGTDVNAEDVYGMTALSTAAKRGDIEVVRALLAHPDTNPNIQDSNGHSAIFIALRRNFPDIFALLAHDPRLDFTIKDRSRATVMMNAQATDKKMADVLLSTGRVARESQEGVLNGLFLTREKYGPEAEGATIAVESIAPVIPRRFARFAEEMDAALGSREDRIAERPIRLHSLPSILPWWILHFVTSR